MRPSPEQHVADGGQAVTGEEQPVQAKASAVVGESATSVATVTKEPVS